MVQSEKRSAYVDTRDEETNENWDEGKLKDVVEKKHGKEVRTNATQIVSYLCIVCYISGAIESCSLQNFKL